MLRDVLIENINKALKNNKAWLAKIYIDILIEIEQLDTL